MLKKFIFKFSLLALVFILINVVLLFGIPKNNNGYLCEYNRKVALLETTQQPRIIFVGGSNIAFGVDSHAIQDSLNMNVINFGLHAGLGIKLPLEDCLDYVRKGDVVVIQTEYAPFYNGGNGDPATLPAFMAATNWRYVFKLHYEQWKNVLAGLPKLASSNMQRFKRSLRTKSFDSPKAEQGKYAYVASGFNDLGDEVSHWSCPNGALKASGKFSRQVDEDFVQWLATTIHKYEEAGAEVIMLPPVCVQSHYENDYNDDIAKALKSIGRPYVVAPSYMVLDDSCYFNTGYHVNRSGVIQNTNHIITVMREHL